MHLALWLLFTFHMGGKQKLQPPKLFRNKKKKNSNFKQTCFQPENLYVSIVLHKMKKNNSETEEGKQKQVKERDIMNNILQLPTRR